MDRLYFNKCYLSTNVNQDLKIKNYVIKLWPFWDPFANKKRYRRPPDQKILEYAKKNEIELIVRGTEYQKGISRYISIHF